LKVDFVVCTLAVGKKNQGRFRHVGSDHSLVSPHVTENTLRVRYKAQPVNAV
jgi:hypothetical protein